MTRGLLIGESHEHIFRQIGANKYSVECKKTGGVSEYTEFNDACEHFNEK